MIRRCCPVPNCTDAVPEGPHAIFCVDHYHMLPTTMTGFLFRLQMKGERSSDVELRKHVDQQLPGYIAEAVRMIERSPATPGGVCRRQCPAGVNPFFGVRHG